MKGSTDMAVRLLHFSDTHLGHQQYPRTDPDSGLNQREADHYAAFRAVIDHAVQTRPDAVLHAGDLFDGVRPSNRALAVAMEGFLRLSQAGIPTVLIAGNHEHPRMRETGSPFRLFEHLDHVHPVYKGRRETIALEGGLRIHAVPQCADHDTLRREVDSAEAHDDGLDVLMLHGAIQDLPAFQHAEFNELTLDPRWFERFDYTALGHYHGTTEVTPKAWYCGAPDRVSLSEAGQKKGFLEATLGDGPAQVTFHAVPGRPYVDLPILQADGLDAAAVLSAAETALARVPEGAVCRLRIQGLDPTLRGTLDQRAIRAAAAHALHLDLRPEWADSDHRVRGAIELRGLGEEFEDFAAQYPLDGLDRDRLLGMARDALGKEASR